MQMTYARYLLRKPILLQATNVRGLTLTVNNAVNVSKAGLQMSLTWLLRAAASACTQSFERLKNEG